MRPTKEHVLAVMDALLEDLLHRNTNDYEEMLRTLGRYNINFFNNNRDKKIVWPIEGTNKVLEITYTRDGEYLYNACRDKNETDRF